MKSRFFSFVVIMVHIVSVNCRHLAPTPNANAIPSQQVTIAFEELMGVFQDLLKLKCWCVLKGESVVENRIGSSPPSCEHKCYGCSPCEATQVPTIGGRVNVSIQYSNYELEGWKCKCGPTLYSP
ncbi:polygalacturonase-like [Bidens hawaiensis]|uniref:polygalacturonase-like n=1 Tax=Bidens hawaiensis TaxID=980011 RepID=UPI00404A42B5